MAQRSRTTFVKRQKEQARQEKQRAKLQRRLDKKRQDANGPDSSERSEAPEDSPGPLEPISFDAVAETTHDRKSTEEQS